MHKLTYCTQVKIVIHVLKINREYTKEKSLGKKKLWQI